MTAATRIDGGPRTTGSQSPAAIAFATERRRSARREEWAMQERLIAVLARDLDPRCAFATSLENRPASMLSGIYLKRRGCRSGLPDVLIIYRRKPSPRCPTRVCFLELKSRRGIASKSQKQVRTELLPTGAKWFMVRSVNAALMALHLAGVPFRPPLQPAPLEEWEGPFLGSEKRLPAAPEVRAERAAARRRWRKRTLRERVATALAERDPHGAVGVNGRAKMGASAPRNILGSRLRIPLPPARSTAPSTFEGETAT